MIAAAIVLLPPLVVLAYQAAMRRRRLRWLRAHALTPVERSTPAELRVLLREVGALLVVGLWHLPPFPQAARRRPRVPPTGPPVLAVHGFMQNGSNWVGLRRRLEAAGRVVESVSLGFPRRPPAAYAAHLTDRLKRLIDEEGGPVDVVCHSMGGLVLRAVLHDHPELRASVRRVVTIASPHDGTAAVPDTATWPDVRWMHRNATNRPPSLLALIPADRITTFASPDDNTVYPESTSHLPGTRAVSLAGLGHSGLVVSPRALDPIAAALLDPA